jgi:hypothetical protein
MLEKAGDVVAVGMGALTVAYVVYEIARRKRRLHDIWDVLGPEDADLSGALMDMVENGELEPFTGGALA